MVDDFSFNENGIEMENEESIEERQTIRTKIGPGAFLQGTLQLKQGMEILGNFKGDILSNSRVKVLKGGHLEGSVDAFDVTVEGEAKVASMNARKRFAVTGEGKFTGTLDIQPEEIVLSEYALFGSNDEIAEEFAKTYTSPHPSSIQEKKEISLPDQADENGES